MTEMSSAGIVLPKIEINKKVLNSLPKAWDINVFVIKTTKNLNIMTLAETMAIIKASEMDGQQLIMSTLILLLTLVPLPKARSLLSQP